MKGILALPVIFLICANCFSQQPDSTSKPELIYLNGFFSWKKGNTKLRSPALRKEIFKTSVAIPYFKKGNSKKFISETFFLGGMLFTLAAIGHYDDYYDYYYYTHGYTRGAMYASFAFVCFATSVITFHFSLKDFGKAVNLRNLDILKQ